MNDLNYIDGLPYKTGIYTRVSREDEKMETSESIYNQRTFLELFIAKKGWILADTYSDDGYTGTNFNRPEFKRMLQDIKNKKIDIVITKDLSRLGRDYIETGYFIEKFFPENNIRFIAVNDSIDTFSNDNSSDMSPFRSVINDMYAKDISKKVRTVMDTKRKCGKFIGAFAPYGYAKSQTDKNLLIPDDTAAQVVKKIFGLYISGKSCWNIAGILNDEKVLSPSIYKQKGNEKYNNPRVKKGEWTPETIKSILTNPTYTGNITQNKYKKINYKVNKLKRLGRDQWITVKNTHEPIVTKDEFYRVQDMIGGKAANGYTRGNSSHILSGILYCGDCGEKMTFTKTKKGEYYCICSGYKRRKNCTRHAYKEKELEESLKNDIRQLAENNLNLDKLIKYAEKTPEKSKCIREINAYESRLSVIRKAVKKLYEDRINEILSEDDFLNMFTDYSSECKDINKKLEMAKNINSNAKQRRCDMVLEIINFDKLDRNIIIHLVDRILLYDNKKMKISYRFSCK